MDTKVVQADSLQIAFPNQIVVSLVLAVWAIWAHISGLLFMHYKKICNGVNTLQMGYIVYTYLLCEIKLCSKKLETQYVYIHSLIRLKP